MGRVWETTQNENLNAKTDQMIPNPVLKQVILLPAFNVVSESNNNLKMKRASA